MQLPSVSKRWWWSAGLVVLCGFFLTQLVMTKGVLAPEPAYSEVTLTPTPALGSAPAPGLPSTGGWQLVTRGESSLVSYVDLALVNTTTHEERILGTVNAAQVGTSAVFAGGGTRVVFASQTIGRDGQYNPLEDAIVVYAIAENKIIKTITLADIKAALPTLAIPRNGVLTHIAVSPSNDRIAVSYGYAIEPDYTSDIIVITLSSNKIVVAPAKGLVKQWANEGLLRYETIETVKSSTSVDNLSAKVTRDIAVSYWSPISSSSASLSQ